jgi:TRAP-type uncharacterized transport system substrate-binding protein
MLVLGLAALAAALAAGLVRSRRPVHRITLAAGPSGTTRALVASMLVDAVTMRGGDARLVETSETKEEIEQVDAGVIDLALVSEAYRIEGRAHVREVAPLYVEAVHLLVKEELVDAAAASLGALRGRTIDLGPRGSTNAGLAAAVLAFAGVPPADAAHPDGYVGRNLDLGELDDLVARSDRTALPDAVLHLATMPSKVAMLLIQTGGYRLVPLAFAEAFRLNGLLTEGESGPMRHVDRRRVTDTVIPAFT